MTINSIHTEGDYNQALIRLNEIFDAPVGTSESNEADILVSLIEAYEEEHHPIDVPASFGVKEQE